MRATPCGAQVDIQLDRLRRHSPRITVDEQLAGCDGIIVPGGFGDRGIEGMITSRRSTPVSTNIPYLGICLGMQIAVIEYARNVCAS